MQAATEGSGRHESVPFAEARRQRRRQIALRQQKANGIYSGQVQRQANEQVSMEKCAIFGPSTYTVFNLSLSVSASGANTISIHRIISKRVATLDSSKSIASSRTSEYSIVYRLRTGSQFQVDPVNMKLTSNVRARLIAGSETPLLIINWAAAIVPVRVSSFALDRNLICKITLY